MYQNTYKTKSEEFYNLDRAAHDFTCSQNKTNRYPPKNNKATHQSHNAWPLLCCKYDVVWTGMHA